MTRKILIPLDGSATAEGILPPLRRLMGHDETEVVLLHAITMVPIADGYHAGLLQQIREGAERHILETVSRLEKAGVRTRAILRDGPPAETILEVAREEGVSLIAMATHGRSGLSRWVFGSVTEKVLRASPVPLLVVRSFAPTEEGDLAPSSEEERVFRNVLIPLDGSETSLAVVPTVAEFARHHDARATILYVEDPQTAGADPGLRVAEALRDAQEDLERRGVPVDRLVRQGDPALEILRVSRHRPVDLMAMSTHGRSGFSRWVFGSVTEKVMRTVTVPMLLVRAPVPVKAELTPRMP